MNYNNTLVCILLLISSIIGSIFSPILTILSGVLFAALWDVGYYTLRIDEEYNQSNVYAKTDSKTILIWYRFYQHFGIFLFMLVQGLFLFIAGSQFLLYPLCFYFLYWSGLPDFIWHYIVDADHPTVMKFKSWTPVGLFYKYILGKDEFPATVYYIQLIVMIMIVFILNLRGIL